MFDTVNVELFSGIQVMTMEIHTRLLIMGILQVRCQEMMVALTMGQTLEYSKYPHRAHGFFSDGGEEGYLQVSRWKRCVH